MSETNGPGKSRLDRIEEILERHSAMLVDIDIRNQAGFDRHQAAMDRINASIERQLLANEAAHDLFQPDDKRLLTAQILMNAAMTKMADGMASLELKMEETTANSTL